MRILGLVAFTVVAVLPGVAMAQALKARPIDLTNPTVVAGAMREAGYKAELKRNDKGQSYIVSAANGSAFTVEFYGCKLDMNCTSLQFFAWYKKQPYYTIEMANRWNDEKRFLRISIDKDGDLSTSIDISTLGGTYESFADSIDWWSVMTGDLFEFLDEEEKAAGAKK